MKKILLLLMLSASSFLHSQTIITTYYVIPPTSGCNGVWAIDASQLGFTQTYIFTPTACALFSPTIVGDTAFLPLCSLPCTLTVTDTSGNIGICGTGLPTSAEQTVSPVFTTYPNPATAQSGYTIITARPAQEVKAELISLSGQIALTHTQAAPDGKAVLDTSTLEAGTYIVKITVDGAPPVLQKLVML